MTSNGKHSQGQQQNEVVHRGVVYVVEKNNYRRKTLKHDLTCWSTTYTGVPHNEMQVFKKWLTATE